MYKTLQEAVAAVLEDSDSDLSDSKDICILPTEVGEKSEREDINEDDLIEQEPGEVSGELEVFIDSRDKGRTECNLAVDEPSTSKGRKRSSTSRTDKQKKSKVTFAATSRSWKLSETYTNNIPGSSPPSLLSTQFIV